MVWPIVVKQFSSFLYGVIQVPMSKLMMLVAAKWRDFSELNPHTQPDADVSTASVDEDNRSSRAIRGAAAVAQEIEDEDEEDEDSDRRRKSRGSRAKKGKKASKVPTLKIKLSKRKRGSSVRKQKKYWNIISIVIIMCVIFFIQIPSVLGMFVSRLGRRGRRKRGWNRQRLRHGV